MAVTGSPRRGTPARRVLVGAARIAALLAIIVGVSGVLAPALTFRPAFYAVALAFAVTSFVLLQPRYPATPPAGLLPPVPPAPVIIVDEAKVAAAREEERDRWASEVSKSVDAVRRTKQELTASEETRAALTRNVDELTQTILSLRQQTAAQQAAATQKIVRADSLIAELNAELTATREAAEKVRADHARERDELQQSLAKREAEWSEKLREALEGVEADAQRNTARGDARIQELQRALENERGVREQVATLARELQQQLNAAAAAQGDLHRATDQERAARERIEGNARDLATRLQDVEQKLAAREAEWKERLEQTVAERDGARAELSNLQHAIDTERIAARQQHEEIERQWEQRLQTATTQRESEWNEKVQSIVTGMAADHENDLGRAIEERERARAEVRSLSARFEELERNVTAQQHERNTELREAIEERDTARAEARSLNERIKELEQQLGGRETEWNDKLHSIVTGMAADHENDLGEAIEQRETARAEVRSLSGRVEELERQLAARDAEFDEKLQKIVAGIASDHENDLGEATTAREEARAEARHLTMKMQQLQRELNEVRASAVDEIALREKIDAEWSAKLQTIVAHLASDHDEDIGKAMEEKEEAKAEVRTLTMKVNALQQQIERDRQLFLNAEEKWTAVRDSLTEKANAAQQELDALRRPAPAAAEEDPFPAVAVPTPEPFASPFGSAPMTEMQRSRADVLEIAEQAHAVLKRTAPGTVPIPHNGRRPLILFVHHDPTMRTMWRDQLHKHGYDVITAADGLEGLRLASAQKPEVVIADTQMPKMDGRELCQLIKSNEQTGGMKVVLMSGMQTAETPREGFQPDEVLRKPVKFDALQSALANLLAMTH